MRYIDDLELRQVIQKQLNKIEPANRFTRAIAAADHCVTLAHRLEPYQPAWRIQSVRRRTPRFHRNPTSRNASRNARRNHRPISGDEPCSESCVIQMDARNERGGLHTLMAPHPKPLKQELDRSRGKASYIAWLKPGQDARSCSKLAALCR